MILSKNAASALASIVMALSSTSCAITAFSTPAIGASDLWHDGNTSGLHLHYRRTTTASSILAAKNDGDGIDTDTILPSFATKEEYMSYMQAAGQLPAGFAVGTASGEFVSAEAPAMGKLPIKATVIHLTEGPTDSWAAVFTSNKVSSD